MEKREWKLAVQCALLAVTGGWLLQLSGCQKKEESRGERPAAPRKSAIWVNQAGDGIHIVTSAAEFVLTSTGRLTATLASNGRRLTLEDPAEGSGQAITVGHRDVKDI
jgi:hypothetical protein